MASYDNIGLELRHVEASKLEKLASIIDQVNGWQELLDVLSRPLDPFSRRLGIRPLELSSDSINLIKQQYYCGKSPSLALLNHWSITGRRRPTVAGLLGCLRRCNFERAADYVVQAILGIDKEEKTLGRVVAEREIVETSVPYAIDGEFKFENINEIINDLVGQHNRFSFRAIYESTNKFCHRPYDPSTNLGTRIGDGRFSSVFRACTSVEPKGSSQIVAAKLLKSECNKRYLANEINLAARISHPNILELLGISIDGDSESTGYICLVYPFIQNGSLLTCLGKGLPCQNLRNLSPEERHGIALGVAEGIAFLHSFGDAPVIHRDIKSANILIDLDVKPKIGDFTLVRQLDPLNLHETQYSLNIIGTSIYMPPEAFRGDISTKFDVFSFGVVILELLTGMKPFNDELEEDLLTIIGEKLSDLEDEGAQQPSIDLRNSLLMELLDKKAGNWNLGPARALFNIALKATENRKRDRPEIVEALSLLKEIEY